MKINCEKKTDFVAQSTKLCLGLTEIIHLHKEGLIDYETTK